MFEHLQHVDVCTTWGTIVVKLSDEKVVSCILPRLDISPTEDFSILNSCANEVFNYLASVFKGNQTRVPALGKLGGTNFQLAVWDAISSIPAGEKKTYGELAESIDKPKSFRAVANACGANPAPLFIPCHRVIGANNTLGGFSCGIAWKKLLLAVE